MCACVYMWQCGIVCTLYNDNQIVKNNFSVSLKRIMSCFTFNLFFFLFFSSRKYSNGCAMREAMHDEQHEIKSILKDSNVLCTSMQKFKIYSQNNKIDIVHIWMTRTGCYFCLSNTHPHKPTGICLKKICETKTKNNSRIEREQKFNEFIDMLNGWKLTL